MHDPQNSATDENDQTRETRSQVTLECEVRQGVRPWKMTLLEDISEHGFRIAWFPDCRPELPLRIRIPGLQLLSATVRWQRDYHVGCAFSAPLHPAVLDHIVSQANLHR